MHSRTVLATLAAASVGLVSAQRQSTCTQSTITIENAAQATSLGCEVVEGTILIEDGTGDQIAIEGPERVGSIVVKNATSLVRLSSTTITVIEDEFSLADLDALSTLQFSSLRTVGSINWVALDSLGSIIFGTSGVTRVNSISISDTFLSDLSGLNVASVDTISLNNNKKLVTWESDLVNVTDSIVLQDNGGGQLEVNIPNLESAGTIEIRNVKTFAIPALTKIDNSLKLDENDAMESFRAPNLTSVREIAITDNEKLTNISIPLLETIDGAFTIQNNTALEKIAGFPKLTTVRGALILRGDFTDVSLPKLETVFGQGTITSTQDIRDSCGFFDDLKDGGDIRGDDYFCSSDNEDANESDGNGGDSSNNSNGGSNDDEDAAGMLTINLSAVLGVALVGGLTLGLF